MGNCVFKGTGFNFNRIMANAANCTIVECEELVEVGEIKPEGVHLPGLNVNRIFKGAKFENRIEVLKLSDEGEESKEGSKTNIRDTIAQRAALEFVTGMQCNLGVGMPTLASSYASKFGRKVFMQSENGMMGVGGYPKKGEEDSDWINAGKESIVPMPGSSTFGSDVSFGQIRGGHLDMTVLGALECSQYGDIANYMIPGKMVKGMGGAMVSPAIPILRDLSLQLCLSGGAAIPRYLQKTWVFRFADLSDRIWCRTRRKRKSWCCRHTLTSTENRRSRSNATCR